MHAVRTIIRRLLFKLLLPLSGLLLYTSCFAGGIGYGIVLWPEEGAALQPAEPVRIISESTIEESYIVEQLDSGDKFTLPRWRIENTGPKQADAETAAAEYAPYAELMAVSREVGLPVRSTPDALSDRVYRLRQEEEMKVLSRSAEPAEVGSFTGYWYEVLTRDGTVGYTFDHYLILYQRGEKEEALTVNTDDPRLDEFLGRHYYPERYRFLISRGTVDLERIRPEMGLIPDQETMRIEIVAPKFRIETDFETISSAGNNRYAFGDDGLYITFETSVPPVESVIAQYKVDGEDKTARYVAIDELEELLEAERTRRDEALAELIDGGNSFVSNAYGRLVVDEEAGFSWTGKERLVPSIVKERYGDRGTIRFDRFLTPELVAEYTGAASFHFAGAGPEEALTFLYSLDEQGVRLTLVPAENVDDLVVNKIGYNPLVLFMSRQE